MGQRMEVKIVKKYRTLIIYPSATADGTDPIQGRFGLLGQSLAASTQARRCRNDGGFVTVRGVSFIPVTVFDGLRVDGNARLNTMLSHQLKK